MKIIVRHENNISLWSSISPDCLYLGPVSWLEASPAFQPFGEFKEYKTTKSGGKELQTVTFSVARSVVFSSLPRPVGAYSDYVSIIASRCIFFIC